MIKKKIFVILLFFLLIFIDFNVIHALDEECKDNAINSYNNSLYYCVDGIKQKDFQIVDGKKYFFSRINDNAMKYGWINYDGTYYYADLQTGEIKTGLQTIDDKKYYFNKDGVRQKDFQIVDGKKYFFSRINDNAMKYGWINYDGTYYYADLQTGEIKTGLQTIDGEKYYFNNSGVRQKDFQIVDGKKYFFSRINDNTMKYGWINYDGTGYYADLKTGEIKTGLQTINNRKYYFNEKGERQKDFQIIDDKKYFFSRVNDNAMKYGWISYDGTGYYADLKTGEIKTGLQTINNRKYYFNEKGERQKGFKIIGGKTYFFSRINDNAMKYSWQLIDDYFYYFNSDGSMQTSKKEIGGITYYFNSNGTVKLSGWQTINNSRYYFDVNNKVLTNVEKLVIDVSAHQGKIDWNSVANSDRVYGVILRIGYWNTEDARFKEYISEVKRLGIPYGIYLFSYASTTNGAQIEANFTNSIISKYNLNPTLGIYYDLEDWYISSDNTSNILSGYDYDNISSTYLNGVRAYIGNRYKVKLYANLNYANNRFNSYSRNEIDWIAQYNNSCSYTGNYSMWQFTSSGTVKGINGYVDMSYLFS